jgi:hypothetical protein
MKFHVLLAALLFSVHSAVVAQETAHTYQPAGFPADSSRIIRRIKFPASDQEVFVRVFCESHLTKYGELEGSFCASEYPDADPYIIATTRRIDRSRLEPARVDGTRVPVWFQYTVQFERKGESETIKLFPHHFVGLEGSSGEGYSGPQRYREPRVLPCLAWYDVWVTVLVPAEGGKPIEVAFADADEGGACNEKIQETVSGSDYIPAFQDGVAISAPYREHWWKVLPTYPRGARPAPQEIIVR